MKNQSADTKKIKRRKVSADDYVYATARIRAREVKLLGKDGLMRLVDAKSVADSFKIMSDNGFELVKDDSGDINVEETLGLYLKSCYKLVSESVPEPGLFDFLRYNYDCHNIKSAIKCEFRGEDFAKLYVDLGTLTKEKIVTMMRERSFDSLPENMAKGAPEAIKAFAGSSDPQMIDIILDTACYKDMIAVAESYKKPFFKILVRRKIDITNILTCVRILRMKNPAPDYFTASFIPGGFIGEEKFALAFSGNPEKLLTMLSLGDYRMMSEASALGLAQVEKLADDCYLGFVKEAKNILYGAEVICSFLISREYEVKNIRIIIASKQAEIPPSQIREKLREIY